MATTFKKIQQAFKKTEIPSDHPLSKQPIPDGDAKITLYRDISSITTTAIESYVKSMSKSIDLALKERIEECLNEFTKYESKTNDVIDTANNILLNNVIQVTVELQNSIANEVMEFTRNLDRVILKPLSDYQKEVVVVKENRKELKEAYSKMENCKNKLEQAKREVENYKKQIEQLRIQNDMRKQTDAYKALINAEEKTCKYEKELDDARLAVNEKYDRYTEGLFKHVSEEIDLANCYLEYLKEQRQYHYRVYENLDDLIPKIEKTINDYPKKPIFGCSISEHLRVSPSVNQNDVSPVIRKLIESMVRQNAFYEEGIFRIAGSKAKMNRLIYSINSGYLEYIDFNDYDVHCLASVLKQYLRDLPDSIMCNDFYDDWLYAVNSGPKIEAYRHVLKKLPKPNYENLKYIVKFLACIVENSERTKMNANNIGICFGMSLLNTSNSDSSRNIDMGTASNAFDYMLSNHNELFPGEINFAQFLPSKQIHHSNTFSAKSSSRANINPDEPVLRSNNRPTVLSPDVYSNYDPTSRPVSVMVPDRKYIENDLQSHYNEFRQGKNVENLNKQFTQAGLTTISEQNNVTEPKISRSFSHSKKPSTDLRFDDSKSPSPSPETTSTSSISASPRLKAKKQAPAPPPVFTNNQLNTSTSSTNSTLNDSLNNNNNNNLFPRMPTVNDNITSNNNTNINQTGNGNNNNHSNNIINNKLKSVDSSSNLLSTTTTATATVLEKPSVPPPTVPRPPPIGFNVSLNDAALTSTPMSIQNQNQNPTIEINSPTSTLTKPPKPALPRKPLTSTASIATSNLIITTAVGSSNNNDDNNNNNDNTGTNNNDIMSSNNKVSSEITSL